MQLTIFHMLPQRSYRQSFGFDNPPPGTILGVKYMTGLKWYLHWENCPDEEDIIQTGFPSADKAFTHAKQNQWIAFI